MVVVVVMVVAVAVVAVVVVVVVVVVLVVVVVVVVVVAVVEAFVPVTPWVLSSFCFWVQGFSPTSGFSLRLHLLIPDGLSQ